MTIAEETVRYVYAGPYVSGNMAPIPFTYDEPSHVKVARDKTLLRFNIDYQVLGQNVILEVPISALEKLVIFRETPMDNLNAFPQESKFDSEKISDSLDKLTRQNQEQQEALDRALKLPIDAPTNMKNIDLPIPEANKGLKWNEDGTKLINTKYDTDEIADRAEEQARIASQQATLASAKALEAQASAQLAAEKAEETKAVSDAAILEITEKVAEALSETEAIKDAAGVAIEDAKDGALDDISAAAEQAATGVIDDITTAKIEAIHEVEGAGQETIDEAKSWAIGNIASRPEGSAKWWAEQVQQTVTGDYYTKHDTDRLLQGKQDAFTEGTYLTLDNGVLDVDTDELTNVFPTQEAVDSLIEDLAETKQDKLVAGSGVSIAGDGKTISLNTSSLPVYTRTEIDTQMLLKQNKLTAGANITISDLGVISAQTSSQIDAYTKGETNLLLQAKQDVLTAGNGITITNGTISADTYTRSEITSLLNGKQSTLVAGNYIEITGNTISSTCENMIKTYTASTWNNMSTQQKAAVKYAFVYE